MTTAATIWARLMLDSSDYKKGLDESEKKTSTFSSSVKNGLAIVGGALTGVVIGGFAAVGKALYDATGEASAAEDIQAQLGAVLKSTGGIAGVTADQVNSMADRLQGLTRFEDDAIIGGENMLLTFTNIGKNVFPDATETMLDMSQALGQDLKSSAMQLGKSLNDPIAGVSALQRVGVNLTAQQEEQIKTMMKLGDVEGAQKLILKELSAEFGGSAQAAGKTFAGQMDVLKNKLGNVKEQIGGALLPTLTTLASTLTNQLSDPAVIAWITSFAEGIANFAQNAISKIPDVITALGQVKDWLSNNQGVVVGILAALGIAILAFGVTVATAAWTALSPLLPVIAVMALVGLAAYALYEAWQSNFMGIQQVVGSVMTWVSGFIQSALAVIQAWWAANGTAILANAQAIWNGILTAISVVITFISVIISAFLAAVSEWWSRNGAEITEIATAAWTAISTAIGAAAAWISSVITAFIANVQAWWAAHGTEIGAIAKSAWDTIQKIVQTITDIIITIAQAFIAAFNGDWYKFGQKLREAWDTAWAAIKTAAETIWATIKTAFEGFVKSIVNFVTTTDWGAVGKAIIDGITSGIKMWGGNLVQAAVDAAQAAWSAAQGIFGITPASSGASQAYSPQSYSGMYDVPAYATGADFIVPSQYQNDSYLMAASAGEHVQITPAGQSSSGTTNIYNIYPGYTEKSNLTLLEEMKIFSQLAAA